MTVLAVLALLLAVVGFGRPAPKAAAAAASTVNFQSRLLTAAGATVPDGNYNVEFKLYNTCTVVASSGGCTTFSGNVWTETRTGTDKVRVVNGYLTVNLGSVNAFTGVNWDQDLWMTMNIGGTSSPVWDGEMSPALKLTAVPYAFQAGGLANTTGANRSTLGWATQTASNSILLPNEGGTICIQGSVNCGFLTGGSVVQLQGSTPGSAQTGNFNVTGTGIAGTLQAPTVYGNTLDTISGSTTLNIGTTNATSGINLNQNVTVASGKTVTIQGATHITANSATALQVTSAGGNNILTVDTSANIVKIISGTMSDIASDGTSGGALQIGPSSTYNLLADDNEIMARNGTGADTLYLQKAGGGLRVQASVVLFKPTTDTAQAFQIQPHGSSTPVFNVDTSNSRVGIGTDSPLSGLDVYKGLLNTGVNQNFNMFSIDSSAAAQNVGGGIGFGGNADSVRAFSAIQGYHESATSTDYAGALRIFTRPSAGDLQERLRVTSTGKVGIANTNPGYTLDVTGDINASNTLKVGGNTVCTSSGCSVSGSFINLQASTPGSAQTGHFNITGTGIAGVLQAPNVNTNSIDTISAGGTLSLGTTNATAGISLGQSTTVTGNLTLATGAARVLSVAQAASGNAGNDLSIQAGTGNGTNKNGGNLILQGGNSTGTGIPGSVIVKPQTNSAIAFQVQNAAGTSTILDVDTSAGRVGIGNAAPSADLDVGPAVLGASQIVQIRVGDFLIQSQQGAANGLAALTSRGSNGNLTLDGASGSALYLSPFTTNNNYLASGGGNVRVGSQTAPGYKLDVSGDVNIQTGSAYKINGSNICTASGCTASSSSAILNQTSPQSANTYVQAATNGSVAAKFQANAAGTGDIMDLLDGSSNVIASFSSTGGALFKSANSANAFAVQNSTGASYLSIDTSAATIKIGDGVTTTSIVVGDGTNNVTFAGSTREMTLNGNARHSRRITLQPEFAGAVMTAQNGCTSCSGTMTSDAEPAAGASNLSSAEGYGHTFYSWTTTQGTNQNYDIWVSYTLPSDFSAFSSSTPFSVWTKSSDTTNGTVTLQVMDADRSPAYCYGGASDTAQSLTPSTANTWEEKTPGTSITSGGCSFSANDRIWIRFRMQAPSGGTTKLGELRFDYYSKW